MSPASDYRGWAGQSHGWRYLAQVIDGSGGVGAILDAELPLQDVSYTDTLSGPAQFQAVIDPVALRLLLGKMDQPSILRERGCLIHAEQDDQIRGSFMLMGTGYIGPKLSLDGAGLTIVAKNIPYGGALQFVETDPADIIRHIWDHIQDDPDCNINLNVNPFLRTPLKVGHMPPPPTDATATGSESSGTPQTAQSDDSKPYDLNWWSTHDLGGELDKLCSDNSIEYHERHVWNGDKTNVLHYLDLGYPALGVRRELRFVVGENIQVIPSLNRDGADYANEVNFLGAGEGSDMVRATARVRDGRVRTVVTVDDKSVTDPTQAARAARLELAWRQQLTQINDVVVRNTPNLGTIVGSFEVGDEIRVQGMTDWAPFDTWGRVLGITVNPDNPDAMKVSLMRSDWVVATT